MYEVTKFVNICMMSLYEISKFVVRPLEIMNRIVYGVEEREIMTVFRSRLVLGF